VLTQAVTAKFKRAAGFHEAGKNTAATIAPTQRRRALEETAVAVIRIADNEERTDPHPRHFRTRGFLITKVSCLCVQLKTDNLELE
jgi:hypothetical protein